MRAPNPVLAFSVGVRRMVRIAG
eukprot:COSAG03_NODE_25081_length_268_cov_0.562130_1_plen_22_part_10